MSDAGRGWRELGRLIELIGRLRADEAADPATLRGRDAAIAEAIASNATPREAIDRWLAELRRQDASAASRRPESVLRAVAWGLTVIGAVLGAAAAAVVFAYTGEHPVNVVTVLGVFVGLQAVALLLTLIGLTPGAARRVPGWAAVQELASVVSPGRLAGPVSRLLPADARRRFEPILDASAGYQGVLAPVQRAALLTFAQGFGLAFNVAALLTALLLIVTRDLAFGWSTTLELEAATAQRIAAGLAWPWGWAWPAAMPSLALVESTRYFRVEGVREAVDPVVLGRWWPFVVMAMATYGVLPRAAAWGLAHRRLSRAAGRTAERVPGVAVVRMRLERLRSRPSPGVADTTDAPSAGHASPRQVSDTASPVVVTWAGAPSPFNGKTALAAGGGQSVANDRAAIEGVSETPGDRPVLVVTKAWEPPLAELFDFVAALRGEAPGDGKGTPRGGDGTDRAADRPVWLLPVGVDGEGRACEAQASAWDIWRRTVAARRDAGLRVLRWNEVTL